MIKIAILGRGGQGVVKASRLLAEAAFLSGFEVQAFPSFGTERRGSPVEAYIRLDNKKILLREQISEADYAIIFDPLLAGRIKAKKRMVNSSKKSNDTIDAVAIANKIFPKAMNMAMIAAFVWAFDVIKKDALIKACNIFPPEVRKKNIQIIKEVDKVICKQKKNG